MSEAILVKDKRGTWLQAFREFAGPIGFVLIFRWLILEPFVIPSGSMIPTLLVHDHILVSKWNYGIRLPFASSWIFQWASPSRGDVVVFEYPENPNVFYIKRVVAISGDDVEIEKGQLKVNGSPVDQKFLPESDSAGKYSGEQDEDQFSYFSEGSHIVRYRTGLKDGDEFSRVTVPPKSFFVMGDNRDQSSDSRIWGFVSEKHLIGKARWIILSCDKTLQSAPVLCDPQSMRWGRILKRPQ
jgi:signal peptidase I